METSLYITHLGINSVRSTMHLHAINEKIHKIKPPSVTQHIHLCN